MIIEWGNVGAQELYRKLPTWIATAFSMHPTWAPEAFPKTSIVVLSNLSSMCSVAAVAVVAAPWRRLFDCHLDGWSSVGIPHQEKPATFPRNSPFLSNVVFFFTASSTPKEDRCDRGVSRSPRSPHLQISQSHKPSARQCRSPTAGSSATIRQDPWGTCTMAHIKMS